MFAQHAFVSQSDQIFWAKLDGAESLLKAVVNTKTLEPRSNVLRQGDVPTVAHVLLEGHTYRYKLLRDGRRQITALLVPGDISDLEAVIRGHADYSVAAMTRCVLGEVPVNAIADPASADPEIARALWRRLLRDEAISRERLVNIGCRTALERVAHLVCELRLRLQAVGLTKGDAFKMQLTQAELADVLGMSTVHINRVLKQLRENGLVKFSQSTMSILNVPALEKLADFYPAYLRMV